MDLPSTDGTLMERLGIEVLEASPARVVAKMPVEGNVQPFDALALRIHDRRLGDTCRR